MGDVRRAVEAIGEQLTDDVAADLRKAISIPVDYSTKPETRSKPGEYPRMDKKLLIGSVQGVTYWAGDVFNMVVSTNTPYDEKLNSTRPFRDLTESKWARLAEQRFAIGLR